MNKIEIINEILNVYEENNNLKNTIEFLKEKDNKKMKVVEKEDNTDSLERRIYKIGFETLFNEGFSGTYISKIWNSEKYPDVEEWANDHINLKNYEEISIKEFKELYGDKIKNAYDKALEKAMKKENEDE